MERSTLPRGNSRLAGVLAMIMEDKMDVSRGLWRISEFIVDSEGLDLAT